MLSYFLILSKTAFFSIQNTYNAGPTGEYDFALMKLPTAATLSEKIGIVFLPPGHTSN
jgi:hypothetical protein